jgi:hypothetical protein
MSLLTPFGVFLPELEAALVAAFFYVFNITLEGNILINIIQVWLTTNY